jgi:type IV pilus assembly protein PilC
MNTTYQYRVRDSLGHLIEGQVEAAGADAAAQQLRRDGFVVLSVDERDDGGFFPRRVSKSEIVYVTSQLAVMVDTGITISAALGGIMSQESNPTLRRVLVDLKSAVEAGDDFSSALAKYPKLFDKTYIALVRASEATGKLGTMLDRIAGYLRKELDTRGRVRAAVAYPAVMLVVAIGVTIFLLTYVLPKFTPLFNRRGIQLPGTTVFMMKLSEVLTEYWPFWIAGAVALVAGFFFGKRTDEGKQLWDWCKINVPLSGSMLRKVIISRSIRTLGTMLASGVPVLDAIRLCADVAGNFFYERLWLQVLDQVTTGKQICEALTGNPLFPPMLVQMISTGEETGKLDVVLERVSGYYDQEVESSLKTVTAMLEPIMITVMGVVVGGIAMSLLLPIFSLSRTPG